MTSVPLQETVRAEEWVSRIRVYRPGGRGGGEQTGRGSDRERQRPRLGTDLGSQNRFRVQGSQRLLQKAWVSSSAHPKDLRSGAEGPVCTELTKGEWRGVGLLEMGLGTGNAHLRISFLSRITRDKHSAQEFLLQSSILPL